MKPPKRRCTATTNAGDQCRVPPIKGGTVCVYHGGSAPQVREAANRRLREMATDALDVLAFTMTDRDVDSRTRLQAARDVLDRLGVTEPKVVQVITRDLIEAEIERLEAELGERATVDDGAH